MHPSAQPLFPGLEHLGSATDFVSEIHEVARVLPLFDNFTLNEYRILCEHMDCYATPSRATILSEGTHGDFLILVLTGRVEVRKSLGPDEHTVLARVGAGAFLGEMSMVDGQHRFASCIATQPTDFAVLTREALTGILKDYPSLGAKLLLLLLQLTTARLRDATTRMLPAVAGEWA
jgi:CRP/FNR family cyclic AMP-dependent transcriptional regulator